MGDFALIDSYLESFRRTIEWHADTDDLLAEVTDHLLVSVETAVARGADPLEAQTASLDSFGDPRLVSRAFASTSNGGVALPTEFTKKAGVWGIVGSISMLFLLIIFMVIQIPVLTRESLEPWEFGPWMIWVMPGVLAFTGLVVLHVGLERRHGGALGWSTRIAAVLAGAAALLMVMPWMFVVALPLAGIGTLAVGVLMLRVGVSPRIPTMLFAFGPLVATGVAVVAAFLEIGPVDYWGDNPAAFVIAEGVAALVFVPGFFMLSRWLASEVSVDDESETPLMAG